MDSFFNFIKTIKWLVVLLLIVPFIVIMIFIVYEFVLGKIDMNAGEWSGLLGSALSYMGTVSLGILAFWQNERLSLANDKLSRLQLEQYTPYLVVKDAFEEKHLEDNRNPDTTRSILSGSRGQINFQSNTNQNTNLMSKQKYEERQNELMKNILINDLSKLTSEKLKQIDETYIEMAKLRKTLPKPATSEKYIDTFWILTDVVVEQIDSYKICKLGDSVGDTHNLEKISIKIILTNESAANIKSIIFQNIEFSCGFSKWFFSPNPNKNSINNILKSGQDLIMYVNLFIEKNNNKLVKLVTVYDVYNIKINIKLITVGKMEQEEEIFLITSFGSLSEFSIELL